jgi:hypothetical protein
MKFKEEATQSKDNCIIQPINTSMRSISSIHSIKSSSTNSSCCASDIEIDHRNREHANDNDEVGCTEETNDQHKSSPGIGGIGSEETSSVRRGRIVVFNLLVLSAISAGFFYWSLRRSEYKKFQITFDDDSTKLSNALFASVMNTLASMDLLSTVIVAHAKASNETWPFVTLPHFGNIASKTLSMSSAISFCTVVLVNGTLQRHRWEEYAWGKMQTTINETFQIMETDVKYQGEIAWNSTFPYMLHDDYNPLAYES